MCLYRGLLMGEMFQDVMVGVGCKRGEAMGGRVMCEKNDNGSVQRGTVREGGRERERVRERCCRLGCKTLVTKQCQKIVGPGRVRVRKRK